MRRDVSADVRSLKSAFLPPVSRSHARSSVWHSPLSDPHSFQLASLASCRERKPPLGCPFVLQCAHRALNCMVCGIAGRVCQVGERPIPAAACSGSTALPIPTPTARYPAAATAAAPPACFCRTRRNAAASFRPAAQRIRRGRGVEVGWRGGEVLTLHPGAEIHGRGPGMGMRGRSLCMIEIKWIHSFIV